MSVENLIKDDPHGFQLPGMTRLAKEPCCDLKPHKAITTIPSIVNRPIIILATATITDDNIFANGLFQNIYFLYCMFDAMGWTPILMVNQKPTSINNIPESLRACRFISIEDIVKQPMLVKIYMEIGMSIDPMLRRFLKRVGARICKLYLGNILNIDIETPVFYGGMNFSHHVVGDMDEIWVSPHYGQHDEYASALNHVDPDRPQTKIAPYIWDPCIFTDDGRRRIQWQSPIPGEKEIIVIMEPNISFQKTSFVPIMAMERWFRKNPNWNGEINVMSSERLMMSPLFRDSILPTLELHKAGKIKMRERLSIVQVTKEFPSATYILHQWNNEYNYMLFELFWAGIPVIHNSQAWGSYGYCYKGSDLDEVGELYSNIRQSHADKLQTYRSHARTLAWKHSPYNPEIQSEWAKLVD